MMLTADSSVWIDYFNGADTPATAALDGALDGDDSDLVLLDVVLMEVLRGFRSLRDLRTAEAALSALPVLSAGGEQLARSAAALYRRLRAQGITVRSSIDLLVGAWCIDNDVALLHADRDFDGMVRHHGLRAFEPPATPH